MRLVKPILLLAICTLFSTWQYLVFSLSTCDGCLLRMNEIYNLNSNAPFAYRILTPAIIVLAGNSLMTIIIFQTVMFALFFGLLMQWCSHWRVDVDVVLPFVAIAVSYMMPTFYFSLYTVPEWVLWLSALLLMRWSTEAKKTTLTRKILLFVLLIVGTLNREITGLLILLSIFTNEPKDIRYWLFCGIAWVAVLLGLRNLIPAINSYTIAGIFYDNTMTYRFDDFFIYGVVILLIAFIFYRNFIQIEVRLKLMILGVLIPYFGLWFLFASWSETRLLMPLLIMAIPVLNKKGACFAPSNSPICF